MKTSILISSIILVVIVASIGLLFADHTLRTSENTSIQKILFPTTIDYKMAPHSHVDIQRSCAGYFVPAFQNITNNQVQQSQLLQQVVSGKTGDGLPLDATHTRQMLQVLEKIPDESGKGEFGINHDGKSYYLKYEFVHELRSYTDHVIGCYRDGLLSHFKDEPIVKAFESQYGNDIFRTASDDSVSFSDRVRDVYSARLHIVFDENFKADKITVFCNDYEKEIYYEITEYDEAWNHVNNYHCYDDKYPYAKISINEIQSSFAVGEKINDFTIKLEGYYPRPHAPDIKLVNETNHVLWTNYDDIGHVTLGRISPVDFCKEYKFHDIGDPVMINNTGEYKFVFSFEKFSLEHIFFVRENISGNMVDKSGFGCS